MNNNMKAEILVRNGFVDVRSNKVRNGNIQRTYIGTLLSNMAYYGYIPSNEVLNVMFNMDKTELEYFWTDLDKVLSSITGNDRNMDEYVVYKNFPTEVLEMSAAEYWFNQVMMYFGAPNEWFTEEERARPKMTELTKLKVLHLSKDNTLSEIFSSLCKSPTRWTKFESESALYLEDRFSNQFNSINEFGFKENAIELMVERISKNKMASVNDISDATDVLRLAAGLNGSAINLREMVRWTSFKRPFRKLFLRMLEDSKNLDEDISMRPEVWKRFLHMLHPGDYKNRFPEVKKAYNNLYNDSYKSYNKIVDGKDSSRKDIVNALKSRPGDFLRRFHGIYGRYGAKIVDELCVALQSVSTKRLISFQKYIETINDRKTIIVAPKGNWTKAKVLENTKRKIDKSTILKISESITEILAERLTELGLVYLDDRLSDVKLPTNDQDMAEYSRGTSIKIPDNIKFIRSASFWEHMACNNTWFDNGWNFFNKDWKSVGTTCWNSTHMMGDSTVFSGDPTNSKDLEGKACQMIDLYLDKLVERGVRYAVWNILAYSNIEFSEANDVLATLQFGEDPLEGKLYEPSRAEIVFPIKGDSLTKYIAYIDLVERKVIYMDANLKGEINSALNNAGTLSEVMPAYVEYLNSLPSIWDLFKYSPRVFDDEYDDADLRILYSDLDYEGGVSGDAFVYRPEHTDSKFNPVDLGEILNGK